jgi:hypothetical protein
MAKLIWHQEGQKRIEYGVDRGVFYSPVQPDVYDNGVVWNGLVNVDESSVGGDSSSYHFDGVKYLDTVEPRNYQATISAYSIPRQLSMALGEAPITPGVILTRQPHIRFGLSYRTFIGDNLGYKIHLVYNILATSSGKSYPTINDSSTAEPFTYQIDATPTIGYNYRPTAHYILDSSKLNPDILIELEKIIYGTNDTTARLPLIGELLDLIQKWAPLLIIPQSLTGLADLTPGVGDLYTTQISGINRALQSTRLKSMPIDGLYRLE